MSWSLGILCLAAFAIVAFVVSAVMGMALPLFDRLARGLRESQRAMFWFSLAALPAALAWMAVGASLLPALGIGHDHCLAHGPHHPHICPYHAGHAPSSVLVMLALLLMVRAVYELAAFLRSLYLGYSTSHALAQASDARGDVLVFACDEPEAFVLGGFRSRIHASHGLLALGRAARAALAHERAHVRHRHLFWRMLCPLVSVVHWPQVAAAISKRLALAQEIAADREAADALGDPLQVADSLVTIARLGQTPAPGLSFTHGDLRTRVLSLLNPTPRPAPWAGRLLVAAALAVFTSVGICHEPIHHGLETILGSLS